MSRARKLVILGIVIIAVIASFAVYYLLFQSATVYTRVEIPLEGSNTYNYHETHYPYMWVDYTFGWNYRFLIPYVNDTSQFGVMPSYSPWNAHYFHLAVGAIHTVVDSYYGGIEIKVSEIHSDYIVLLVKPLS
jgi:hypothetical protein